MMIPDEGFPHSFGHGRGIETGNMYITFDIEFPTTQQLHAKQNSTKSLAAALPNNSTLRKDVPNGSKIATHQTKIVDMTVEERKQTREDQEWQRHKQTQERQQQSSGSQYEDEEEEGGHFHSGGGQPACQQL